MATTVVRNAHWFMRVVVVGTIIPLLAPLMTWLSPNGLLRTPAKSAADVLRAAFDTRTLGDHPKELYLNGSAPVVTGAEARDPKKRAMLWHDSVGYTKLTAKDTVLKDWN